MNAAKSLAIRNFGITIAQQWSTRFAVPGVCKAMLPLLSPVRNWSAESRTSPQNKGYT
jgi:hypothetical protein